MSQFLGNQLDVLFMNVLSILPFSVDIEDLVSSRDKPDCQVHMRSYATYIRAMGGVVVFVFLLSSFIVSIVIQSLTTGYLAYWFNQGDGNMVSV